MPLLGTWSGFARTTGRAKNHTGPLLRILNWWRPQAFWALPDRNRLWGLRTRCPSYSPPEGSHQLGGILVAGATPDPACPDR